MEAERRSTMSSLKGQLSNVEGSVKSMKVAVVVGSVLTVACLAAVFGVTVLANEVSKEVKVSNGTLTSKSGEAVLTTSTFVTDKVDFGVETLVAENMSLKVNGVVVNGETTTVICDDLIAVEKNGKTTLTVTKGSVLASVLGVQSVEKRSVNMMTFGMDAEEEDESWCGGNSYCESGVSWLKGKACDEAASNMKGGGVRGWIVRKVASRICKELIS